MSNNIITLRPHVINREIGVYAILVKARKEHTCIISGETIRKGELYYTVNNGTRDPWQMRPEHIDKYVSRCQAKHDSRMAELQRDILRRQEAMV